MVLELGGDLVEDQEPLLLVVQLVHEHPLVLQKDEHPLVLQEDGEQLLVMELGAELVQVVYGTVVAMLKQLHLKVAMSKHFLL